MNADEPIPPPPEEAPLILPSLNMATQDAAQVGQLLRDIELCAVVTEIIPKYSARGHVPDTAAVTLAEARELLASKAVRGLQVRYRYQGADWWDTLMAVGDQFRLVRIRHDFAHENVD